MKRILIFLLVLIMLPLSVLAEDRENNRHLTLMVYLCGSDLETRYGLATRDLLEIRDACRGNDAVTVLVMAGGSSIWHGNLFSPEETCLCEIGSRGMRIVGRQPSMNMGEAETLADFLRFGVEQYPADQYALVLWNHGAGPMEGVCFDEQRQMDSLSLQELESALQGSPFAKDLKLSWIGFDACLMATVETALYCAPYAEYLIASQETEPGSGWNYGFLQEITGDEDALEICGKVLAYYPEGKKEQDMLTLSLVRLNRMKEVEKCASLFFEAMNLKLNPETFSDYSNSRQYTKSFGRVSTNYDYDLVDLYSLAESFFEYAPAEAEALEHILEQAVVLTTGNQEHSCGLSIYYPYYNKSTFEEKWQDAFRGLGVLTDYSLYLNRYEELWTGKPMALWDQLSGYTAPLNGNSQTILLDLTEEQSTHYANAFVHILEDDGTDYTWLDTYCVDDIRIRGNTLEAEYSFDALYAVDENGVLETEAIPFTRIDDYYLIHASLQEESVLLPGKMDNHLDVILICKKKDGTNELEIHNVIPAAAEADELSLGREEITPDPETWPVIRFYGTPRNETKDEKGSWLPFDEWPENNTSGINISIDGIDRDGNRIPFLEWQASPEGLSGLHHETEADNTRPWTLKFCPRKTSGRNLAAQYIVTDTQGNKWASQLIPLQRPDIVASAAISCEPVETGGFSWQPVEIKAIRNDSFQGVCLRMQVENHTDSIGFFTMIFPIINGRVGSFNGINTPEDMFRNGFGSGYFILSKRQIMPGATCYTEFYLEDYLLPYADDPIIRSITFIPDFFFYQSRENDFSMADFVNIRTVETGLDVSGLDLPERPESGLVAADQSEPDMYFELTELHKTEIGAFAGTLHVVNRGKAPRWITFQKQVNDTYRGGILNYDFVYDCMDILFTHYFIPGGEGYFDFRIIPGADLSVPLINIFQGEDEETAKSHEKDLTQLEGVGFLYRAYDTDLSGLDQGPMHYFWFYLPEPVDLGAPWHLILK